jgi:site-specific DNA recombinase
MNLAFGYIRRSSYKQQENNSFEIQRAHIQEFAKRNQLVVPEEFLFIEDVTSAFSKRAGKRKELMRLRDMMIEANVPRVIFYEESRMDRTGYTFVLDFYRPLREKFTDIEVYTTNSEEPFNPDNPQTKIALLLYRQESEIKSERALQSLSAMLQGEEILRPGSKTPFGYTQVEKKLIPNDKAEIVTFIYHLSSWGTSMSKIATLLNEADIPSPQGKLWNPSTVENILKNPVYTGKLKWHLRKSKNKDSFEFENFAEPLIDEFLLFLNENNIKLQNEFGRLDTPFLFLNKLHCQDCNEKLITHNGSTTRNGKRYSYQYYVCNNCNYKLEITGVHERLIPLVLRHVHSFASDENIKELTIRHLNSMDLSLKETIVQTEKHLDKVISKGCIANEINDSEFALYYRTVKSKYISKMEDLIKSQQALDDLYEAINTDLFFDRFKQILEFRLGDAEKRLIILYFINKVVVSPEQAPKVLYQGNVFGSFEILPHG